MVYRRCVSKDMGEVFVWREHDYCFAACQMIWNESCRAGDDWPQIADMESEDILFIASENPGIALDIWGPHKLREIAGDYYA